jgi:hypothetical protein
MKLLRGYLININYMISSTIILDILFRCHCKEVDFSERLAYTIMTSARFVLC